MMGSWTCAVLTMWTHVCRHARRSSRSVTHRVPRCTSICMELDARMEVLCRSSVLLGRASAQHRLLRCPHRHRHRHRQCHHRPQCRPHQQCLHLHPHRPRCQWTVLGRGRLVVRTAPRATLSLRPSKATVRSVCLLMVRRMCARAVWMSASHLQCAMRSSQDVECRVPRSIASMAMSVIGPLRWCCSVLLERATAVRRRRLPHLRPPPCHRAPPCHLRHCRLRCRQRCLLCTARAHGRSATTTAGRHTASPQ